MRISDLNTSDQSNDSLRTLGVLLRTILSPPLLKHLGHGRIFKFPSNIPRWTRWQMMSAREKEEPKKGYEEYRLEHGGWKRHNVTIIL